MAQISRPTKAAGNANYTEEVADGKLDIIDAELDEDFNKLYTAVNNLDSGAITGPIPCASLALTGCIEPGDLAPGFTIPPSAIPPKSITLGMLDEGATVQAQVATGVDTEFSLVTANQEYLIVETVWTSRGSFWLAFGMLGGRTPLSLTPSGVEQIRSITLRLRLDPSAPGVPDGTILQEMVQNFGGLLGGVTGGGYIIFPFSFPLIHAGALLPATAHRLQLTAASSVGTLAIPGVEQPRIDSYRLIVMEQA